MTLPDKMSKVRRHLHRFPETGFALDRTRGFLRTELEKEGLTVCELAGGLVTELGTGGDTVVLRADMDALPVPDGKDVPYRSQNPGFCHACGHDGHAAILYGAACLLKKKGTLPGRVRLVFQPAEECPPGGALGMIRAGVLNGAKAAFALHLNPDLPQGKIGVKDGPMMAATDNFTLTVTGKRGHAAMPHRAVDAVVAAGHLLVGLQSLVSRNDPLEPLVITMGKIEGGTAANVIADSVRIEGTVRTLSEALREVMPDKIKKTAEGTCGALGAGCDLEYLKGYPVLESNPAAVSMVSGLVREYFGEESLVLLERPVMGGEDFAYFLQRVPGCFIYLGTGHPAFPYPLHHSCFDFDEAVLSKGAELMAELAIKALFL